MNNLTQTIESLFERAADYKATTHELIKLKVVDKSASVISTLVAQIIIAIAVSLFALLLNIGLALWIGQNLGKSYYGFFIVSGFYGLFAYIIFVFRNKWIKVPLNNSIITQILKQ